MTHDLFYNDLQFIIRKILLKSIFYINILVLEFFLRGIKIQSQVFILAPIKNSKRPRLGKTDFENKTSGAL